MCPTNTDAKITIENDLLFIYIILYSQNPNFCLAIALNKQFYYNLLG